MRTEHCCGICFARRRDNRHSKATNLQRRGSIAIGGLTLADWRASWRRAHLLEPMFRETRNKGQFQGDLLIQSPGGLDLLIARPTIVRDKKRFK